MADISDSGQQVNSVNNGKVRMENGNNRMILFDGTVNRLVLGELPNGQIGLVISKERIDVLDVFG